MDTCGTGNKLFQMIKVINGWVFDEGRQGYMKSNFFSRLYLWELVLEAHISVPGNGAR